MDGGFGLPLGQSFRSALSKSILPALSSIALTRMQALSSNKVACRPILRSRLVTVAPRALFGGGGSSSKSFHDFEVKVRDLQFLSPGLSLCGAKASATPHKLVDCGHPSHDPELVLCGDLGYLRTLMATP